MAIQRVKPLTIRDVERRWMLAHGTGDTALAAQEIVTTSDQRRLWRGDGTLLSGGVDHGTIAAVADLATLYLLPACTRGVWPGDTAFVTAAGCEYRCISGNNATAVWRAVAVGGGSYQPLDDDLTAIAALSTTEYGRSLLTLPNRSALQTEAGGGGGGSTWAEIADAEVPSVDTDFDTTWMADGDTKGFCYLAGTNFGAAAWTNPHNSGAVTAIVAENWYGLPASGVVDRASVAMSYSQNATGEYLALDMHRSIVVTDYSLQSNGETSFKPRNWKLQGSNNVQANTTTGIAAATWVDLDVRTADSTIQQVPNAWGHFVLGSTTAAYRWFRVVNTGLDSSGGSSYLTVEEVELYCGQYTLVVPRVRPVGSRCWLTDGEYYVPAW